MYTEYKVQLYETNNLVTVAYSQENHICNGIVWLESSSYRLIQRNFTSYSDWIDCWENNKLELESIYNLHFIKWDAFYAQASSDCI